MANEAVPKRWTRSGESTVLKTPWFNIRHTKFVTPAGAVGDYYFHDAVDSVLCVCLTGDGKFLLEEQYRLPVDKMTLDFPAGHIERTDETVEAAVRREVEEETGLKPTSIKKLAVVDKDAGFSTTKMHIFLAYTEEAGKLHQDATEDIKLKVVSAEELMALLRQGKLTCAVCIAATLLAFQELELPIT